MHELNQRARAIWAYSCLSQEELADRAGIAARTLHGYLRVRRPRAIPLESVLALARAAGIPNDFALYGFRPPEPSLQALDEAVDALEAARERVDGLRAARMG